MLIPAKDFFENLPVKRCSKCGSEMEEQTECYGTMCPECEGNALYNPYLNGQDAR